MKAILLIMPLLLLMIPDRATSHPKSSPIAIAQKSTEDITWTKNTDCGVPFWIAWNVVTREFPPAVREIYIFVEPQNCTREYFIKIFSYLSEKYLQPENLFIIARSDKAGLRNRAAHVGWDWEGKHVSEVGYYRADYSRTVLADDFIFTPNPNKEDISAVPMKLKFIQTRTRAYTFIPTGDRNWDLVLASYMGLEDEVKRLLDSGADVNGRTKYGNTPLLAAIPFGNSKIVNLLLERGADVNQKDPDGWTPLMYALVQSYRQNDIAEELLRRGAEVNARAENGDTALLIAVKVSGGLPKMVERLLHLGADVNVRDQYGKTPLMIAEEPGHTDEIRVMLKEAISRKKIILKKNSVQRSWLLHLWF